MERIKTLETRDLCESAKNGGCGECQTSCQSACKTAAVLQISSAKRLTSNSVGISGAVRVRAAFFCVLT